MAVTIWAVIYELPGGLVWAIADIVTGVPAFVNLITILLLSRTFFALLRDYKARYMGINKVDPSVKVFYEDSRTS
jgi:AGCS family alanine or glycine:cation symporter